MILNDFEEVSTISVDFSKSSNPNETIILESPHTLLHQCFSLSTLLLNINGSQEYSFKPILGSFYEAKSVQNAIEFIEEERDNKILLIVLKNELGKIISSKKLIQVLSEKKHLVISFGKEKKGPENIQIRYVSSWIDLIKTKRQQELENIKRVKDFCQFVGQNLEQFNAKQFNMKWMLVPFNRKKAKKDFFQIFNELKKIKNYQDFLVKEENNDYNLDRNWENILRIYKNGQFSSFLNNSMKLFGSNPKLIGYFRLPFSDLYYSIKEAFQQQSTWKLRKKNITVYMKTILSQEKMKKFEQKEGSLVQFQGFTSASLNLKKVLNLQGNGIIQIDIHKEINKRLKDVHGFAFISHEDSNYIDEKIFLKEKQFSEFEEAVFNPMNLFEIEKIQEKKQFSEGEKYFYIKLKLVLIENIEGQKKNKKLIEFSQFINEEKNKIFNQGDVFFLTEDYSSFLQYDRKSHLKKQGDIELIRKRGISHLKQLFYHPEKIQQYFRSYLMMFYSSQEDKETKKRSFTFLSEFYEAIINKEKQSQTQILGADEKMTIYETMNIIKESLEIPYDWKSNTERLIQIQKMTSQLLSKKGKNSQYYSLNLEKHFILSNQKRVSEARKILYELLQTGMKGLKNNIKIAENEWFWQTIRRSFISCKQQKQMIPLQWIEVVKYFPILNSSIKALPSLEFVSLLEIIIDQLNYYMYMYHSSHFLKKCGRLRRIIYEKLKHIEGLQKIHNFKIQTAVTEFQNANYEESIQISEELIKKIAFYPIQKIKFVTFEEKMSDFVFNVHEMIKNLNYFKDQQHFMWRERQIKEHFVVEFLPGVGLSSIKKNLSQYKLPYKKSIIKEEFDNIWKQKKHMFVFCKAFWLNLIMHFYFSAKKNENQSYEYYRFGESKNERDIDFFFFAGEIHFKANQIEKALEIFTTCEKCIEEVYGKQSFLYSKICLYKAECYWVLKNPQSQEFYKKGLCFLIKYEEESSLISDEQFDEILKIDDIQKIANVCQQKFHKQKKREEDQFKEGKVVSEKMNKNIKVKKIISKLGINLENKFEETQEKSLKRAIEAKKPGYYGFIETISSK